MRQALHEDFVQRKNLGYVMSVYSNYVDDNIVVIDGVQYVHANVARNLVNSLHIVESAINEVFAPRDVDCGWELEKHRQTERDNYVADGQWSK